MFQFNPTDMQFLAIQLFSAYASFSTCMMMFRTIFRDLAPEPLRSQLQSLFLSLFNDYAPEPIRTHLQSLYNNYQFIPTSLSTTIIIDEQCGDSRNEVYDAAEVYLRNKISPTSDRFKVCKTTTEKKLNISIDTNQEITDTFNNFQLTWRFVSGEPKGDHLTPPLSLGSNFLGSANFRPNNLGLTSLRPNYLGSAKDDDCNEKKFFELNFDNIFKETVLEDYLPHVVATAKKVKDTEKVVKLYTTDRVPHRNDDAAGFWGSINLDHPATFETLVMDPMMKMRITEDLGRFIRRRDYYKKVGKAWKRGYLLYGPSGTDRSILVAAMANYLKFDIYDLQLSSIQSNWDLRRLLVSTMSRSIIVIEDIDCIAKMQNHSDSTQGSHTELQPMLSSLLNFLDGLWSDERIIVFTTNNKNKLDLSLLRPGRIDMHIHMSYCTYQGFRLLASNHLGINDGDHRFLDEIEVLIENSQVTPSEIAEELMKSDEADIALAGVVNFLKRRKIEGLDKVTIPSKD